MTIKLTPRAGNIVKQLATEARTSGVPVGPEHVLRALVHDPVGIAGQVLQRRGITAGLLSDLERIIADVQPRFGLDSEPQRATMTAPGRAILEVAEAEARRLGSDVMGTEHLLLALVKDEDGVGGQILHRRGLQVTDVEDDVNEAIAPRESAEFPGRPRPWGSRVEHDQDGNAVMNPDGSLRQYLIDREGRPVLDAEGRRVRWKLDPNGDVLLDETGEPRIEPID